MPDHDARLIGIRWSTGGDPETEWLRLDSPRAGYEARHYGSPAAGLAAAVAMRFVARGGDPDEPGPLVAHDLSGNDVRAAVIGQAKKHIDGIKAEHARGLISAAFLRAHPQYRRFLSPA